ncbi:MAG: MAPEG family protein [Hoeflea sp.]|uniref:MAPEG family protein n=1 Tax=Hoeflea sp. TaxID=1940281 RepID=UPI001D4BF526|nr:MAPEG family protein [Hoeflea sp.]MBU4527924.1 MAPEG family protein [Alphaproteobacteria bacterium]MBU4546041.1 MAPEG family protein [Alphaproteobacteria bacterium]MBU4553274.1 MAPEG family protein [Alphaproteobacteria bacterium]MBV1724348.1 MAPEG family protein [Hoeflea sp.]MBV1763344.1 MAPEG family protein [Hoeflea sp.]
MEAMMPALAAVGIYAALNMAILIWISIETGRLRGKHKVSIGDGGVKHLVRIMRGHANAVENMPMFFVLMLVAALVGMPVMAAHVLGLVFTIGRGLHAWHFIQEDAPRWQRGGGFGLSFLAQLVLMLGILAHGLIGLAG